MFILFLFFNWSFSSRRRVQCPRSCTTYYENKLHLDCIFVHHVRKDRTTIDWSMRLPGEHFKICWFTKRHRKTTQKLCTCDALIAATLIHRIEQIKREKIKIDIYFNGKIS